MNDVTDGIGGSKRGSRGSGKTSRCRDFALGTLSGVVLSLVAIVTWIGCSGGGHYVKLALQPRRWSPDAAAKRQAHHSNIVGAKAHSNAAAAAHAPMLRHNNTGPTKHSPPPNPAKVHVTLGPRPYFLVSQLDDDLPLKRALSQCADTIKTFKSSDFVLGHRGAALQFPEHTHRSHHAASTMGAGLVECDVNLTKDRQLVCRHMRCDLHTTTDVLLRPELAQTCTVPFQAAKKGGAVANAQCCTTDFTLEEIQSLCGKMNGHNPKAKTPQQYVIGHTPTYQTDLYSHDCPHIQSHADYISTVDANGGNFVPEFKMLDYNFSEHEGGGYTRQMYLDQILNDYDANNIDPSRVYPQGFVWEDIYYVTQSTVYGDNAFVLDKNMATVWYTQGQLREYFAPLVENGVQTVAPAIFMLLEVDVRGSIVPSTYARVAKEMGLDIIAWTLERSDALSLGGGWYYSTIADALTNDSDVLRVLDILYEDVGIKAVFCDWAATATFYANCKGISLR